MVGLAYLGGWALVAVCACVVAIGIKRMVSPA